MGSVIKKFMIFGDSYSTYEGHIPEGFYPYYAPNGIEGQDPVSKMRLEETWWRRLMAKDGAELVMNNSCSGSTISYTGYNGDCSGATSFIRRYRLLKEQGFFDKNEIDTILAFGGTNDSWVPSPLGEMKFSDFEEADLFKALPAICYFVKSLSELDSRVIFIVNCDINPVIIDGIRVAAEHFGVETIELSDVDKRSGHPTPLGMEQICDQILEALSK